MSAPPPSIPNENDLEMLSAYLDGELTDRDRALLDQRLAVDSDLRAELDSLRQTVDLVRGLPTLRAPRDFTLDPAIYSRQGLWWKHLLTSPMTLQVAGVLGAAASVILIVGALLHTTSALQDDASSIAMLPTDIVTATGAIPNAEEAAREWSDTPATLQEPIVGESRLTASPTAVGLADEAQSTEQDFDSGFAPPQDTLSSSAAPAPLVESATGDQFGGAAPPTSQVSPDAQAPSGALGQVQAAAPAAAVIQPGGDQAVSAQAGIVSGSSTGLAEGEAAATETPTFHPTVAQTLEKESQTPTAVAVNAVAVAPTVEPTALPNVSSGVQPQTRAAPADDNNDLALILVGTITLSVSLLIGFTGWKRSRP